jgi:hypothetical protein
MKKDSSTQPVQGDVVGQWRVVSSAPVRTAKGLMWTISCPLNHEVQAEHSALAYAVVPQQCAECVEAERIQRGQERAAEKRLIADAAKEYREKMRAEKAKAVAIAGFGISDVASSARAIKIPAQVVGEEQL